MAWSKCDTRQLKKLRDNLVKLQNTEMEKFCVAASKELAAKLLALVIPATPVGDYSREITVTAKRDSKYHKKGDVYKKRVNTSGKNGGTLRRGWTARTEAEATSGSKTDAVSYANSMLVQKSGNTYKITVINPVMYASYVEFGHRTPGGGWEEGQYFLTHSEEELKRIAPKVLERELEKLLKEAFKV